MIAFLLKASLVLAILLGFYKGFLERESFFSTNRTYLLACLAMTFTLPFITLPQMVNEQGIVSTLIEKHIYKEAPVAAKTELTKLGKAVTIEEQSEAIETATSKVKPEITDQSEHTSSFEQTAQNESNLITTDAKKQKGLRYWILMIYYFGVGIFFLNFLFQIGNVLLKIIRSTDKIKDIDSTIINSTAMTEPCSFFQYIFINPESYDYDTYEQILAHEKIHVQKKHSYDLLLSEIAVIFLWFNPLIWLFRKEVEKNIEYQTDDILINGEAVEKESYQMNLLKVAAYSMPLTITTNYNQSLIKQRIMKISAKKSNPQSLWKYTFIAPLAFTLLLFINKPNIAIANELNDASISLNDKPVEKTEEPTSKNLAFDDDCEALLFATRKGNIADVRKLLATIDPNCVVRDPGNEIFIEGNTTWNILRAQTPLVAAGRIGDFEIAKLLINEGADVNFHGKSNETPLMAAAKYGDIEFVKYLVSKGAKTNTLVNSWGSASSIASREGHLNIVKYLKSSKAEIDSRVPHVGTSLIEAATNGHLDIVKYLIAEGANVNIGEAHVGTPLICAAKNGHLETVQFLILKGAALDKSVAHVGTPLIVATKNGHSGVVTYLSSKGADMDNEVAHVGTPLLVAAKHGEIKMVKELISQGADVDKGVAHVGTPLIVAAKNGEVKVVKYLISKGADINKGIAHVGTPLIIAAQDGQIEIVKLLIKSGANLDKEVAHVGTPLIRAAQDGQLKVVQYLIDKGANIDQEVAHVGTPLIGAAQDGELEVVKLLVAKGANVNKYVQHVGSPLSEALENSEKNIAKYLQSKGAEQQ
ncbi:MAG: ankyrin repeat protein [Flavobacteriales bacterium]|jgi:ankyrin repeat protein